VTVSLLTAWVVIRFLSQLVRDLVWSRIIAGVAWAIAALYIVGLVDETIAALDGFALLAGDVKISALTVIKGLLSLGLLLWAATMLSRVMERRIAFLPNLTPSIQVLFAKLLKTVLIVIAIVAALSIVGIDLTAFAVFSGAVGVGIGFGLQKVVSNLFSGIILLVDKSVKPGDVIQVGDTYGWINTLGARYASVVTRDGYEYLIPNEDIITQQVINWSFSNNAVRLKIPIGISYKSDVRQAIALCLDAAAVVERVLDEPKSVCLLKGFGDSSVDLELRISINDPQNGVSNVKSQVLLGVWDLFKEHEIGIPFPQRDIHIVSRSGEDESASNPTDL
jgi:small-conductance mechanosensitive channel